MTGFTDVFGSQTIPSAESSYKYLNLVSDQRLTWPAQSDGSIPELSSILKVSCASGNSIILPDARDQSPGFGFLVRNSGSYALGIKDFSLGTVATLNPGGSYYVYLVNNSTSSGTYEFLAFGVGTSNVDAASLIGAGVKALGASLNQSHPTQTYSSSQTVIASHRAQLLVFNGGSATLSLTSTSTLGDDFFFLLKNLGTGTITIDPAGSETIDGQSTFTIQPGESLMVCGSSASWFTVGYGRSLVYQFTQLVKDVSAGGSFVLTATEASNKMMTFMGNPTSPVTVIVPSTVAVYYLQNSLTTDQSVTVKTSGGTGVAAPQNSRIIAMCDSINIVAAQSVQANTSVALIDGTAVLPALSFSSSPSTGIYKYGASGLGLAVNGTPALDIDPTVAIFAASLRVGIGGTPTGTQRLMVKQQASDSYTMDLLGSSTDTSLRLINDLNTVERAALVADSNNNLAIRTNGASKLVIDSSNNMNFGASVTSAPGSGRYFDIYNLENTNSSSFAALRLISQNEAGSASTSADIIKNKAGAFYFNNNEPTASGYYAWALNSSEKMRLNSTGLGVLNNNPSFTVDVGTGAGQMILRMNGASSGASNGSAVYLSRSGVAHAVGNLSAIVGGAFSSDFTLFTEGTNNLLFYMGGAEKARMDSNGKLLLGYNASQGTAKLQVNGTGYINNAAAFVPENGQVTSAAMLISGSYGGGYAMVDGSYYLGMYSISGDLWFGTGTSAGLNGKLSIGATDLKFYGSTQSNIQSNANNGYAAFSATASGTNSTYMFFNNGTGEHGRITVDNSNAMFLSIGPEAVIGFSLDSSLNTQSYGDQMIIGNGADGTTRQKRLYFQSNARVVYFCLNTDNNFNLWDQTGTFNRWTTDTSGNFTAFGGVFGKNFRANSINTSGYDSGYGAGGSVTQLTNKSAPVTLNKPTGRITTHNESMAPGVYKYFPVSNSSVTADSVVLVSADPTTCGAVYNISTYASNGSFIVLLHNASGTTLSDAIGLNFIVFKGSST